MKKLLVFILVVVGAVLAFNYFSTGELTLLPGTSMSEEDQDLNRLKGALRAAAQEYRQAGRQAALSGLDTTHAAGAALAAVNGIERDLKALRKKSDAPAFREQVDELLGEVKRFKEQIS